MKHQFIIAAPNSNAGKTTVTLGLLRLLQRKGISVQPFKVGPDYIDPKFHEVACKRKGVNLDLFMMSDEEIMYSLETYGKDSQVNCIEGVMGLFDGAKKDKGSTAEMAKKLETPVLLVIDAKSVAYSVAPLIQGFINFDPEVPIMGVVFNRVGSERHYQILKDACEDIGVTCFGYLSRLKNIEIPSRHLGLNIDNIEKFDLVIDEIASAMEHTLDWKDILKVAFKKGIKNNTEIETPKCDPIQFAVAKDEAFNFIYTQTVSSLHTLGTVIYFSPLHDKEMPTCDFLYLPGGYPELHLENLSRNKSMLNSIRDFAHKGGSIYAECGGMMYLGEEIISENHTPFSMVGLFNFKTSIAHKKLHLGYRTSNMKNAVFTGHEFHYSSIIEDHEIPMKSKIYNALEKETTTKIYKKNKVIASYVHHYIGTPEKLLKLINEIHK